MPSLRLRDVSLELGLSFGQIRVTSFGNQVLGILKWWDATRHLEFYLLRGVHHEFGFSLVSTNSFSKILVHI